MRKHYLTITYKQHFPNAPTRICEQVLIKTPDGRKIQNPEYELSGYFILNPEEYRVDIDHGWLDPDNREDLAVIEELIINEAKRNKPISKLAVSAGWLSPQGQFYPCGYREHSDLAECICKALLSKLQDSRYLEENGWIRVTTDGHIRGYSTATSKQVKTLMDIYLLAAKSDKNSVFSRNIGAQLRLRSPL